MTSRLLVATIIPTIVFCILILEVGLRATGRLPSNTTDGIFTQHNGSYRLKPSLSKIRKTPSYSYRVFTNSLGFRDMGSGPRQIGRRPYVIFLGDSMTFANGVDYEQSFVGIFGKLAEADGLEVVNLGVGGHSFQEQVDVFSEFTDAVPRAPLKVVICLSPIAINDLDYKITNIIVKNGYLFQKGNWIVPYIRVFLSNSSSAYCFFRDSFRRIQAKLFHDAFRNARLHMRFYRKDSRIADPGVSEQFDLILRRFDTLLASKQTAQVYVYLPASPDLKLDDFLAQTGDDPAEYDFNLLYNFLNKHCSIAELELINLYPVLKQHHLKGKILSFLLDSHYNQEANRIIGEALYDAIINESRHPRGKQ